MLFNSATFFLFLLPVFALYYLPALRRFQVWVLVAASFVFYSWESPALLFLLLISIAINTVVSYNVARAQPEKRLAWATGGVLANLSILGFFKYGALLTGVTVGLLHLPREGSIVSTLLHLPLPIGISFYTFEGISLVVDVLRQGRKSGGEVSFVARDAREHLLKTSLFVAFFPHLVAGPILKASAWYPQIGPKSLRDVPWETVFRCLVTGYFLKVVVADNLKDYTFWIAHPYYLAMGTSTGLVLLFGYSMQIFADFAGYSLIAIGLGALLGYQLPQNFNFPYISRSIAEFWTRWHISLSSWLRDYLYIPLGGNRRGAPRTYLNLMTVMALGGLWHGAAWSYLVWGCYHGVGLAVERFCGHLREGRSESKDEKNREQWRSSFGDFFRMLWVFGFVSLGWLLFKLPDFNQATEFVMAMLHNVRVRPNLNLILPTLMFSFPVVVYHALHHPLWMGRPESSNMGREVQDEGARNTNDAMQRGARRGVSALWRQDIALGLMLFLILVNNGRSHAFIYFQF